MSITNLRKAHGKGFTPSLDTTAGTHSCLNRMLMKEKHRKSRGFGSPWCTRTCTHAPHICTEMVEVLSLFTSVGMHYGSHNPIVCKSGQKVTIRISVREVVFASGWTNTGRTELTNSGNQTAQVQRKRPERQSHRLTAESNKSPHMLMEVSSPKTAHMRPRQLKPQPHGPPGLC